MRRRRRRFQRARRKLRKAAEKLRLAWHVARAYSFRWSPAELEKNALFAFRYSMGVEEIKRILKP